jgi:hypothetical protein
VFQTTILPWAAKVNRHSEKEHILPATLKFSTTVWGVGVKHDDFKPAGHFSFRALVFSIFNPV